VRGCVPYLFFSFEIPFQFPSATRYFVACAPFVLPPPPGAPAFSFYLDDSRFSLFFQPAIPRRFRLSRSRGVSHCCFQRVSSPLVFSSLARSWLSPHHNCFFLISECFFDFRLADRSSGCFCLCCFFIVLGFDPPPKQIFLLPPHVFCAGNFYFLFLFSVC